VKPSTERTVTVPASMAVIAPRCICITPADAVVNSPCSIVPSIPPAPPPREARSALRAFAFSDLPGLSALPALPFSAGAAWEELLSAVGVVARYVAPPPMAARASTAAATIIILRVGRAIVESLSFPDRLPQWTSLLSET